MLIDTHCHLDFEQFDPDREQVIERARAGGVDYIINVGSSLENSRNSLVLAKKYPFIYCAVGCHPHHAAEIDMEDMDELRRLSKENKVVAVGEIGFDFYGDVPEKHLQEKTFVDMLELAKSQNLPLIIHNRNAHEDTLRVLKERYAAPIKAVMHCFSGSADFLKECLDLGMHISFTCNLTFKNASGLREIAKIAPLSRIMLETDAPFLAPQAHRGARNEPAHIRFLAQELAAIKNSSFEHICAQTSATAIEFFGIKKC